ncbi:MAG: hypothetical protein A2173_00840 [Planctomycetes bacterium RBG_13_44_8b]|nr:MAG: hypothetical protein A2173_00840 [Planctomycetes bacterium RBG_13_44_8b]
MGRYYWDKKDTVEDCRSVSIAFLKKHDYLSAGCCKSGGISWKNYYGKETNSIGITVSTFENEKYVRFYYTVTKRSTGEKIECDYKVQLTTTPCNFGGVRYWFICPLGKNGVYCGRRVAKLYCAPGGNYYGCRHCYDLSYESRNEPHHGIFAILGPMLKRDKQIKELYSQTKRWTYNGKPTKKVRKLQILEQRIDRDFNANKMLLK